MKRAIKAIFLIAALFILGCQAVQEKEHIGCPEREIAEGKCAIAPEGEKNKDLFGALDSLDVISLEVSYMEGVKGYLAEPSSEGKYPGIIMIHEWWGLNDNVKDMAKLLANEGYVVLAVDLYDGAVAEDSDKARALVNEVRQNPEKAIANMQKAASYLRNLPNVDSSRIASMGWCFGGGQSLQLALSGEKLSATVIYYGQLVNDTQELSKISWPVLGIFGQEDTSIPVSSVKEFETAIDSLGIPNEIYIYPGVGHAFANPSGSNYAKNETIDAWEKTVRFLNENLKSGSIEPQNTKTFRLEGINYRFLMEGKESPEIRVKQGDRVRIEFTSIQGFHDWTIYEFNASTESVSDGNSTYVEFVADKKGKFEYYCSVGKHRENGMKGNLVVE